MPIGPHADAVLGCYRVLVQHLKAYGPAGFGALIVSMTRSLSDAPALLPWPWRHHHRQQVELLRTRRGLKQEKRQAEADSLLPRLLLTVNAVAGGLRTTG